MKKSVRKRIFFMECKKLLYNPLLLIALVTFFLINVLVVQNAYGSSEDQKSIQKMYQVLQNKEDTEDYVSYKKEYGNLYQNLDMIEIMKRKEQIENYRPTGAYQKFIENNYKKLQGRVNEIKKSDAVQADYYPGLVYKVHSTLFGKLGKNLLNEIVILAFLSVLYLMDYERVQKTFDQVLVTKIGKQLMQLKAAGGILGGIFYSSLLMLASYGYFLWKLPLKGLMNVPVSACMVAEARMKMFYPFVTFWNVNIAQYLLLTVLVFLIVTILAGLLAVAVWYLIKNSYLVFLVLGIMLMGSVLLTVHNTKTFLDILLFVCNPGVLWITCGAWFMENDIALSFAGNEFWILGVCGIVIALMLWGEFKHFQKWELLE